MLAGCLGGVGGRKKMKVAVLLMNEERWVQVGDVCF